MKIQKAFGAFSAVSGQIDIDDMLDSGGIREDDFELASNQEKESFMEDKPSLSYWQDAWRRLKRNRVAMISLFIIILICLFAFIGPMFMETDYTTQMRGKENIDPSWEYPFGTDNIGRDLLVRTMFGARVSLIVGISASLIVLIIGSLYGAISGYFGGRVDTIMMRIADLIYSIPDVLVVLLLTTVLKEPLQKWFNTSDSALVKGLAVLGPSLLAIFIAFGLLYWVSMARIIRGQVLMLKGQEFITASTALGASGARIIRRHLLPNCVGQIIVTTCLQIPSAIFLESFLSFLGVGMQAPLTSLGSMASDALGGMYTYTYRLIIPATILSVMILSLNLFGDGLRDALDPRLKK